MEERLRRGTAGPGIQRRRQLLVFQRLLARLVHGLGPQLVLKGGLALEIRLGGARTTADVDVVLFGAEAALLERLQALGQLDLGDFMTFEIQPRKDAPEITGDGVVYGGKRFQVDCKLAGKVYGTPRFGLDVVFGGQMLGRATAASGEDYLGFAGIAAPDLLLLPTETHIAEKLHAYTSPRPSSRMKDLPDLALLATITDPLHSDRIRQAIEQTFAARGTHAVPAAVPAPPDAWRESYEHLAAEQQLQWKTLDELHAAVCAFLEPVLRAEASGAWSRERWRWPAAVVAASATS
ncbi:MAG TPA: nucleotidyl transferase AbiEii/AbiGii toxin family protein [Kofleriaceae bacterium]|nr:nucleotidyl transferase AbiEii/AbiGii toxin family protein [Kofleriaceae bacterium]